MVSAGKLLPEINCRRAVIADTWLSAEIYEEDLRALENKGVIERFKAPQHLVGDIAKPFADALFMMLLMKKTNQMEVSQLRRYMDLLAYNIAFYTHSDIDLTELADLMDKLGNACEEDKILFDKAFHYKIFAVSGNQLMISLMNALSEIYESSVRFVLTTADSSVQRRFTKAHRDICQSFIDKNITLGLQASTSTMTSLKRNYSQT